jgi:pyruvate dehydrogenase E2 component (dihydrolipoamide acetyltransferase)
LGATGGDVVVEQWLVNVGDRVEAAAPLATVSTDKANVDVEAFRGGYVRQLIVGNGATVPVGEPIALIADSMEESLDGFAILLPSPPGEGKRSAATRG